MGDRESETKKLLAKLEELEREEGEIEVLELGSRNSICQEREEGEIHGDEGEEEQEQIPGRVTGSAGLYDTDAGTGFEIAGNGFVDENRPNSRKKEVADEGAPSGVVQVQAYECFIGDENGASSDMEIEEDIPSPLLRGTHVSAYFDKESTNSPVGGIESQSRNGDAKNDVESTLKRKRLPDLGSNPVIQVSYEGLPRESKKKLQDALHEWSYWHSRRYSSSSGACTEPLESGTDVYSPALYVETTSNGSVSVWMDRPSKLSRKNETEDVFGSAVQEKGEEIPLYDRACVSALSSQDAVDRSDGFIIIEPEESSRCFNCGAYTHSLLNCTRPRDANAIKKSRQSHSEKKGGFIRGRAPTRYYQSSPGGKFDDIKPGALGNETRQSLGIGEHDPPPWLHRMRELGYPPGYLEDPEEESSEVEIFGGIGDEATSDGGKEPTEDGEIVEKKKPSEDLLVAKKMTVEFPGINAPIPENADKRMWTSPSEAHGAQTQRNIKRLCQSLGTTASGGSEAGVIPHSFLWSASTSDPPSRDGNTPGSNSSHSTQWSRHGSSAAYGLVNAPVDLMDSWKRRDGETSSGPRSSARDTQQTLPSPTGLASPLRSMFRAPGFGDVLSTQPSPHIYSRHNQYHPQAPILSSLPIPNNPNEAWLKAQAALGVLQSDHKTSSSSSQPQWGRR
ncbi:zinc finger CCHC domain-containing protein 8 [Marchantia polymorpha subsp. ruderalis]|uniref:PSP proline-rich domain-containing protein n=2 Tax=Marchantia polymorpha TaxID=3197 RepID=A0AAF6BBQ3_MARPO|nr:hypothetical protein MARPO_0126s0021 [Marchantia polymorpha]BBN09437.1 hypothetical protein Mp_4g19730 [Marchantia polymorpha subsp. ruderalis]|eukprot:PTQ30304.1 hypothetical protein MARPO_0126s0021 [Marchantia polymorpha]